jgi:hypothetical protein
MLILNPFKKLQKDSCEKSSQPKSDRKIELLIMCLGIPFYIHIRSGRLHFVKKK